MELNMGDCNIFMRQRSSLLYIKAWKK